MVVAQENLSLNVTKLAIWLLFSVFIFDLGIFLVGIIGVR